MIRIERHGARLEVFGLVDMGPAEFDKHVEFVRQLTGDLFVHDDAPLQLPPPVAKATAPAEPKPRGRKPKVAKNAPAKKARPDKSLGGGETSKTARGWPAEKTDRFVARWKANVSDEGIASEFGLTTSGVRQRARKLGLPNRGRLAKAAQTLAPKPPAAPPPPPPKEPPPPVDDVPLPGADAKAPDAPLWATVDTVLGFLRERDITISRDPDSLTTPRWRVNGKGLMDAQQLLDYANVKRAQMGKPLFSYSPT